MLTWVETNSKALASNIKALRKRIGKDILLMPVIKANAYGAGMVEVAKLLQTNNDVDRLCVVNLDEVLTLIQNRLTKKPLLILDIFELDDKKISTVIKYDVV